MGRPFILVALLAVGLTLASLNVEGRTTMIYPDILGCEYGCEAVSGGFPVPYLVDYPGLSVANQVWWGGAIFGEDRVLWERLGATFAFWLAVSVGGVWIGRRLVHAFRAA